MINDILELLKSGDFYGAGKCTEIAKGKHEYINDWKGFKRKVKRAWQEKR